MKLISKSQLSAGIKLIVASVFLLVNMYSAQAQIDSLTKKSVDLRTLAWPDTAVHSFYYITHKDAETVLKEKVVKKDSSWSYKEGLWRFEIRLVSKKTDTISNTRASLFYSFEDYPKLMDAQRFMGFVQKEGEKTSKIDTLNAIGDLALVTYDSNKEPTLFIRKGKCIYIFRVLYCKNENYFVELKKLAERVVRNS